MYDLHEEEGVEEERGEQRGQDGPDREGGGGGAHGGDQPATGGAVRHLHQSRV